jgi:hypothetical protein
MEFDKEELGKIADMVDNLIAATNLPFEPEYHLKGLKGSLPFVRDRLRAAYIALGGENHWEGRS